MGSIRRTITTLLLALGLTQPVRAVPIRLQSDRLQEPVSAPQVVVIDRLVATVNGDPITESDLLWVLALDSDVPSGPASRAMMGAALEQLIDQFLLYQDAQRLPLPEISEEQVNRYLSELVRRFPSEQEFRRRLDAAGLDDTTLREVIVRRLVILAFIEFRFRSSVFASENEIESYYQNRIAQPAQGRGETPPVLSDDLRKIIEQTIIQDKVDSELRGWFDDSRQRSEINRLVQY